MKSKDRERIAQILNDYTYTDLYAPRENGVWDGYITLTDETARSRARKIIEVRIETARDNLGWIDTLFFCFSGEDQDLQNQLSDFRCILIERDHTIKILNDQIATMKDKAKEIID